jgi:tRNA-dihydrouridine synthase 1
MSSPQSPLLDSLRYIAAPMVNQSDLPFRALVHEHGCTTSYTQMFTPAMLADPAVRDVHLRDMQRGHAANIGPVVAQLAGNDVESLVKAAREIVPWVDGIGAFPLRLMKQLRI